MTMLEIAEIVKNTCLAHGVKPLFAFKTGSKAYGTDNEKSDTDVTFVFYRNPIDYFSISTVKDEIKLPDADVKGWDIRKFLGIISKGGWNTFEMIHAPYWSATESADRLLWNIRKAAGDNFPDVTIPTTFLHCSETALKRLDRDGNDAATLIKEFISYARLTYSALYIQEYGKYPPLNLAALVNNVTIYLGDEGVSHPNVLSAFILFAMGLRKDMLEDRVDFSLFSEQLAALQMLNAKLLDNFKGKNDKEIKENLSLDCEKILQNFFSNFLK
jgi:predicted nucleotidyltransferase